VRLLVGDNQDAVIRRAQAAQCMAQLRRAVGLTGYNRIAQSEATSLLRALPGLVEVTGELTTQLPFSLRPSQRAAHLLSSKVNSRDAPY
jgi:hypothetical protein